MLEQLGKQTLVKLTLLMDHVEDLQKIVFVELLRTAHNTSVHELVFHGEPGDLHNEHAGYLPTVATRTSSIL